MNLTSFKLYRNRTSLYKTNVSEHQLVNGFLKTRSSSAKVPLLYGHYKIRAGDLSGPSQTSPWNDVYLEPWRPKGVKWAVSVWVRLLPGLRCSEQASPHLAHWGQEAAVVDGADSTWEASDIQVTQWCGRTSGQPQSFHTPSRVSCSQPLLLPHAVRSTLLCVAACVLYSHNAPSQQLLCRRLFEEKKDSLHQKKSLTWLTCFAWKKEMFILPHML